MKKVLEDILQEDCTAVWILQKRLQNGQWDFESEGLGSREHIDTSPISIKNERPNKL